MIFVLYVLQAVYIVICDLILSTEGETSTFLTIVIYTLMPNVCLVTSQIEHCRKHVVILLFAKNNGYCFNVLYFNCVIIQSMSVITGFYSFIPGLKPPKYRYSFLA